MTPEVLPNNDKLSQKVKLEVYSNGGHVGFIGSIVFKPQYWLEDKIIGFFNEYKKTY